MQTVFSDDKAHRYVLTRGEGPFAVAWLMVNPSIADGDIDDQTISKVDGFTRRWFGPTRRIVGNKFALVSTDVKGLRAPANAIGPDNDYWLAAIFDYADVVVFGWGSLAKLPPYLRHRWLDVYRLAIMAGHVPLCFGTTNDGSPRHPLMTSYNTPPEIWNRPLNYGYG